MCEVLIVHTSEAGEWAEYLQQVLRGTCGSSDRSIVLCNVNEETICYNPQLFGSCKCIILLLSSVFLDLQTDPQMQDAFHSLFQPPHKVIAFLCGVTESEVLAHRVNFEQWDCWKKLNSEDEPSVYVTTVLNCMDDGLNKTQHNQDIYEIPVDEPKDEVRLFETAETETLKTQKAASDICSRTQETPLILPEKQKEHICITVQPQRILCGISVRIYIILQKKIEDEGSLEVEFHSQDSTPQRQPGTLVNECIVSVQSPDMPAGNVSLIIYNNESVVCSTKVIYYTEMEEISRLLYNVTDPVQFMCQAFSITSIYTESLDNLLADSLKERIPSNGLEMLGISQLEESSNLANHRDVELPTLLHFSAKYGLKKLTSLLMRCPGALQAYSVMNKDGDYPNQLAEKSGFSDLRQFMDEFVETVDLVKNHTEEEEQNTHGNDDIYEDMLTSSQNSTTSFDHEDIYESMMKLNPEMDNDLENVLKCSNPEETLLRKFFEAHPEKCLQPLEHDSAHNGLLEMDGDEYPNISVNPEEEDIYNHCSFDQIYDTVEVQTAPAPKVIKRPPAPVPRPASIPEPESNTTYISKVFTFKDPVYSERRASSPATVRLVGDQDLSTHHDPFAGMKTPGQRQLISLQERVKVGELTVEEAVQEFKAWQFDQFKRSQSLRFQQDNLQKLRNSITRRCKDKGTTELLITAPIQTNVQWDSPVHMTYESAPRLTNQPHPVPRSINRGGWQTGSTSSSSSCSSHRLSIQSTVSSSSGMDGECEEPPDVPLPPRPSRPNIEPPPLLPPPRLPPRLPERNPESSHNERYTLTPSRPGHQGPLPPVPRRTW